MGRTQYRPTKNKTTARQVSSNHKNQHTRKRKRVKVISGNNTKPIRVYLKIVCKHRDTEETVEETKRLDMDGRN